MAENVAFLITEEQEGTDLEVYPLDLYEKNEDANENKSDDSESESTGIAYHMLRKPSEHVKTSACRFCSYVIIFLFALTNVVVIALVISLVAIPYHKAKGFVEATCSPLRIKKDYSDIRCACGKGCHSFYPCAHIMVTLTTGTAAQPVIEPHIILFEDESILHGQCSFHPPCRASVGVNQAAVEAYLTLYGTAGTNYTCLSDPHHLTEAVRTRRFRLHHIVHGLFWPMLGLCLTLVVFVMLLRTKTSRFM